MADLAVHCQSAKSFEVSCALILNGLCPYQLPKFFSANFLACSCNPAKVFSCQSFVLYGIVWEDQKCQQCSILCIRWKKLFYVHYISSFEKAWQLFCMVLKCWICVHVIQLLELKRQQIFFIKTFI